MAREMSHARPHELAHIVHGEHCEPPVRDPVIVGELAQHLRGRWEWNKLVWTEKTTCEVNRKACAPARFCNQPNPAQPASLTAVSLGNPSGSAAKPRSNWDALCRVGHHSLEANKMVVPINCSSSTILLRLACDRNIIDDHSVGDVLRRSEAESDTGSKVAPHE